MIEEFLKTINLSENRFITKNQNELYMVGNQCYKLYYGDFDNLDNIKILNNNFYINFFYNKNDNKFNVYMINGIYKSFIYCYIVNNQNATKLNVGNIIVKTIKTNDPICIDDIIVNNKKHLVYFDHSFETNFYDFEFNHKNVLNFIDEKISSGEIKHT